MYAYLRSSGDSLVYGKSEEEARQEDRQAQASEASEGHAPQEPLSPWRCPRRLLAAALLCLAAGGLAAEPGPAGPGLGAAETRRAEALAWYLLAWEERHARLEADRGSVTRAYLQTLRRVPHDEIVLRELLDHWPPAGPGRQRRIRQHLLPIARDYPYAAALNRVVVEALRAAGDFESLQAHLERLQQAHGDDRAWVVRNLAWCRWQRDDVDGAHALFARAAGVADLREDFRLRWTAARFYDRIAFDRTRDLPLATRRAWQRLAYEHALAAAARPDPQALREGVAAARFLLQAGLSDPGIALLRALAEHPDADRVALPALAAALESAGDLEKALRLWLRLVGEYPSVPDHYYRLGRLLARMGRDKPALKAFAQALQLQLDYAKSRRWARAVAEWGRKRGNPKALRVAARAIPRASWEDYDFLARIRLEMDDLRGALEAVSHAMHLGGRENRVVAGKLHRLTAVIFRRADMPAHALAAAERAYQATPDEPAAIHLYGRYLALAGKRPEEALRLLQELCESFPESAAYRESLALACFSADRPEAGAEALQAAATLYEQADTAALYEQAGDLYGRFGQLAHARRCYREALRHGGTAARLEAKLHKLP